MSDEQDMHFGKVLAIRIYPGGRQGWVEVSPEHLAQSLAEAAVARLGRGYTVFVPDEDVAQRVTRMRDRGES